MKSLEWMARAVCKDKPTNVWFPSSDAGESYAISICNTCPVREECFDYAVTTPGTGVGIFGATTSRQREKERRSRGILFPQYEIYVRNRRTTRKAETT